MAEATIERAVDARPGGGLARNLVIATTAFLTLVDLFATQAILPSLARAYAVTPAAMGIAVNATTMGMAIAGLGVALFSRRIDRRNGIILSLALLAIPTWLLSIAPGLAAFTALRIAQGLCMSAAFTLTLAYLGENCSARDQAGAFAAYITGNVASNLFGRMLSASLADHFGLALNFHFFALLNLAGAVLAYFAFAAAPPPVPASGAPRSPFASWAAHLRNPPLVAAFAIGFCILFAFIGTFTYVNFVLVRPPIGLGAMALGLVYVVFAPSILTTPIAGRAREILGTRKTVALALLVAMFGLPAMLSGALVPTLVGMTMVAAGTFFAQAATTSFVGRVATSDRGAASGIYLASYFGGGLAGSAVLGLLFDRLGWGACVAGIGAALGLGAILAVRLRKPGA